MMREMPAEFIDESFLNRLRQSENLPPHVDVRPPPGAQPPSSPPAAGPSEGPRGGGGQGMAEPERNEEHPGDLAEPLDEADQPGPPPPSSRAPTRTASERKNSVSATSSAPKAMSLDNATPRLQGRNSISSEDFGMDIVEVPAHSIPFPRTPIFSRSINYGTVNNIPL
jgi:hypothetical protein